MDVVADKAKGLVGGVSDVAVDLTERDLAGAEAERRGVFVAGLLLKFGPVDGATVETRRGAGFEAALAEAEALEGFAEKDGGGFAGAAGGVLLLAAVDEAVEEGSGGDDGGGSVDGAAVAELEAGDSTEKVSASFSVLS